VTPGAPEKSMIYLRMSRRQDVFNMPPLATGVVDAEAAAVVAEWIRGLPAGGTHTGARPKGNGTSSR
jgi:hypothetical protein